MFLPLYTTLFIQTSSLASLHNCHQNEYFLICENPHLSNNSNLPNVSKSCISSLRIFLVRLERTQISAQLVVRPFSIYVHTLIYLLNHLHVIIFPRSYLTTVFSMHTQS